MIRDIDALVSSYERGKLTRRQLLCALALMTAPVAVEAQTPSDGLMKGRNLHHVNVRVSDLTRSEAFYRNLFGFSPTRRVQGPDNHGFDLPGGGLIILQKSDQPGRIDHSCVGSRISTPNGCEPRSKVQGSQAWRAMPATISS